MVSVHNAYVTTANVTTRGWIQRASRKDDDTKKMSEEESSVTAVRDHEEMRAKKHVRGKHKAIYMHGETEMM